MDPAKLDKAFEEMLRSVLLGIMALVAHVLGRTTPLQVKTRIRGQNEEGPVEQYLELYDGEVLLHRFQDELTGELLHKTLDGLCQHYEIADKGSNHKECMVCVYILTEVERGLNVLHDLHQERNRSRLLAALREQLDGGMLDLAKMISDPKGFEADLKASLSDSGLNPLSVIFKGLQRAPDADEECNCPVCTARRELAEADEDDEEQPNAS